MNQEEDGEVRVENEDDGTGSPTAAAKTYEVEELRGKYDGQVQSVLDAINEGMPRYNGSLTKLRAKKHSIRHAGSRHGTLLLSKRTLTSQGIEDDAHLDKVDQVLDNDAVDQGTSTPEKAQESEGKTAEV